MIVIQALIKGEQLGLGLGGRTHVKTHIRHGEHGPSLVTEHDRTFDAKSFARQAFRMRKHEIDEHRKTLHADDPRHQVYADELARRDAKRPGAKPETPAPATGTATAAAETPAPPEPPTETEQAEPDVKETAPADVDVKPDSPSPDEPGESSAEPGVSKTETPEPDGSKSEPTAEPEPPEPEAAPTTTATDEPAVDDTPDGPEAGMGDIERRGEGEHVDVGEVLWGARKHKWKRGDAITADNLADVEDLGENEAQRAVDKKAVFGTYDHGADQGNGDSAGASYIKSKIIAAIGGAPAPDKASRQWYVAGAAWLKAEFAALHTVQEVREFLAQWKLMDAGHMVIDTDYTAKEVLAILKPHMDKAEDRDFGGTHFIQDYEDTTPETHKYGDQTITHDRPRDHRIPNHVLASAGFSTEIVRVERDGTTKYRLTKPVDKDVGDQALHTHGSTSAVLRNSNRYRRYAVALTGISMKGAVDAKSIREANKALSSHRLQRAIAGQGALHEKDFGDARRREKDDNWSDMIGEKEKKAGGGGKKWQRNLRGVERVGPALPSEVADGESLRKTFNFKGVQYGNWVEQEAREVHLKHAAGAFHDLASLMGIEPHAITHGGKLGIAFGARGSGGAGAHYEPVEGVINLTHTNGAGTIAHEWAHFFDHQMTADPQAMVMDGKKMRAPMLSHGEGRGEIHPEVSTAFQHVMSVIWSGGSPAALEFHALEAKRAALNLRIYDSPKYGTPEYNALSRDRATLREEYDAHRTKHGRADRMSKFARDADTLGDYWSSPHEMFARCFESYVEDTIEHHGRKNTYLVSGTQDQYKLMRKVGTNRRTGAHEYAENLEPYPQGGERHAINTAIGKLVDAMRRHQSLRKAMMRRIGIRRRFALPSR